MSLFQKLDAEYEGETFETKLKAKVLAVIGFVILILIPLAMFNSFMNRNNVVVAFEVGLELVFVFVVILIFRRHYRFAVNITSVVALVGMIAISATSRSATPDELVSNMSINMAAPMVMAALVGYAAWHTIIASACSLATVAITGLVVAPMLFGDAVSVRLVGNLIILAIIAGCSILIRKTTADTIQAVNEQAERQRGLLAAMETMATDARAVAESVSRESRSLVAAAGEVAGGANAQAAAVEQVSASLEEMSSTVKQNAESVDTTTSISRKAAHDAETSGRTVSSAVAQMKDIEFKNNKGEYSAFDLNRKYNVVVNNFMGTGGDKNTTLGAIPASRKIDTGYIDSEAMLEWVSGKSLENVPELRVKVEM